MIMNFNSTPVVRTVLLEHKMLGPREVDSLGSILAVRAAPLTKLNRIKAGLAGYFTYVIDAPTLYTGHGNKDRKVGDRLDHEAGADYQVYLIFSRDPRFDKLLASYVEARLIDIADETGVPLANRVKPFGVDGLKKPDDLEQLVAHALLLLNCAGLQRFSDTRASRPVRVAATSGLHDVRVVEPHEISIPEGTPHLQLDRRDWQAEAVKIGDRFLVLPGADFAQEGSRRLSPGNDSRRKALKTMDVFEVTFAGDRPRLRVGLDCQSGAMAADIITGKRLGNDAWVEAPTCGAPT
jgi:hypothetical protein